MTFQPAPANTSEPTAIAAHISRDGAGASALAQASAFVRERWPNVLALSVAVLTPCFWHRHIEAADLGSHLYNAWLAHLIERGQAPGLVIVPLWTNVLFDHLLAGLARILTMHAAEKIAVPLVVLIFFWGGFALAAAAARRAVWFIIPLLAMATYGWTFEMGFFNFYLSLGLSFFSLALFWRGNRLERLLAFLPAPLMVSAHPLGLIWLAGAALYIAVAEPVLRRWQILVFLAAAAGVVLLHFYLERHFIVDAEEDPLYLFTGADQFLLFGARYKIVQAATLISVPVFILWDVIRRRREPGAWAAYAIPLQLYLLVELGVMLLPDGIRFPGFPAALALLTERLTSISAVLICCVLAAAKPRKLYLAGLSAIAAVFFFFLYQDTSILNRMEMQVERLVATLPPGQRVLGTIQPPAGSRILIQHMLDRACIGHCFSYGNYEPTTGMFRVRALPGNPYNMTDGGATAAMEDGSYEVQPQDLPAFQIYQCTLAGTDLCIRALEEGEDNDRLGIHPSH
ncbi:MAG TPA: hypothetical protein VEX69_03740 [Candidatus Limnocylindria bacterium]|nr:hypothetical protein [Candidatus Limnocylindria bacterium]